MKDWPWIASYPDGVRWDTELPTSPVHEILDRAAEAWPELPALDLGRKFSYRKLKALCDRSAAGFQRLGVGPGVHVGLYLPNTPHYIVAFFGVLKAGGTVVNYSPLDAEKVLAHKLEDSRTDIMVTLDLKGLYPQMARLLRKSRLRCLVVGSLADFGAPPDAAGECAEVASDEAVMRFEHLLATDGLPPPHRPPARRGGGAAVHRWHHRRAQGRDAHARQPQHRVQPDVAPVQRAEGDGTGPGALARRAAAVPYLRAGGRHAVRPAHRRRAGAALAAERDRRGDDARRLLAHRFGIEELKRFLADKLGKHEMVQHLELRAELPKTPVGKLSKKELVEEEALRTRARATPAR